MPKLDLPPKPESFPDATAELRYWEDVESRVRSRIHDCYVRSNSALVEAKPWRAKLREVAFTLDRLRNQLKGSVRR